MRLTRLITYPVKSAAPVVSAEAVVTPIGLAHDRRWVALDPDGRRVSARECHPLIRVRAEPIADGLRLSASGHPELAVPIPGPDDPTVPVRISRLERLVLADPTAGAWLTAVTGRPLRLAYLADDTARSIGPDHGGRPGEAMSLADAGPLLLVTEASTDRLRDLVTQETGEAWLDREAAIARFRPNLVVDGLAPFEEDRWWRIRVGDLVLRRGELCDRCVMTTLDPETLSTGPEPIRTLARHRRWDGATWFGIRLVPESPGSRPISVGDEVEVLERRAPRE